MTDVTFAQFCTFCTILHILYNFAHFAQFCTFCTILHILHILHILQILHKFTHFAQFCTILHILHNPAHFAQFCTILHLLHNFAQSCTFCTILPILYNFAHITPLIFSVSAVCSGLCVQVLLQSVCFTAGERIFRGLELVFDYFPKESQQRKTFFLNFVLKGGGSKPTFIHLWGKIHFLSHQSWGVGDRKTISRDASKSKKMDRPKYLASASKTASASLPK